MWKGCSLSVLHEARNVARIGDQDVVAALLHAHQRVHRQREDMVERQRADIGQALGPLLDRIGFLHPQRVLRNIGHHVAMQQRRALGDAGRPAGILQEGDVVGLHLGRLEGEGAAGAERRLEWRVAGQRPGRHHLLHAAHDEIDQEALHAHHFAHRGDHDVLHLGACHDRLQRAGEILEDDDRLGAGIVQLVLEFARRVERVDVHHDVAGAQYAHHRHGILQHVRHHDRDARASLQALRLQPGAEGGGMGVELRKADRLAHAGEGRAVRIGLARGRHQIADRLMLGRPDLGRHRRGIGGEPRLGRGLALRRARRGSGIGPRQRRACGSGSRRFDGRPRDLGGGLFLRRRLGRSRLASWFRRRGLGSRWLRSSGGSLGIRRGRRRLLHGWCRNVLCGLWRGRLRRGGFRGRLLCGHRLGCRLRAVLSARGFDLACRLGHVFLPELRLFLQCLAKARRLALRLASRASIYLWFGIAGLQVLRSADWPKTPAYSRFPLLACTIRQARATRRFSVSP